MIKKILYPYYLAYKETKRNLAQQKNPAFAIARTEAAIIKLLHAIEKGLCLEKPRLGFGIPKIQELFSLTERYIALKAEDTFCLYMVRDAVSAYLKFHKENGFSNADILDIQNKLEKLKTQLKDDNDTYGGFLTLNRQDLDFSVEDIEKCFKTRHSVREFTGEKVSPEEIEKAIALAQLCPSACNRQCARVYSVSRQKFLEDMDTDLQGIGGFAEDADRFLLVTAKQSAYGISERNQYIVSAGIFAGYLALTLHAYHIAACTVQRSVTYDLRWDNFRRLNHIPEDEQIVVMFAIGKYKESTKVPVSKRFLTEKMYKTLD